MEVFELVIALLFAGAVLTGAARRIHVPYPALLALAGAGIALLPSAPTVILDPELALTLFVAPVLLDAAFDSSPRDLKQSWRTVTALAIIAVGITVVAVALVVRAMMPSVSWSVAIALGAIVAPPDASAATAVLRQVRLPHRVIVILEGESLFNDASALLTYRLAVATAMTGAFAGWSAVPLLALACAGSVVLGLALSWIATRTLTMIEDVATSVIVQFISTFAVWMLAERLRLSGIITVVVFAIQTARSSPQRMPARLRVPSYAVWEVAVFVLNALAFILIGLQLKPILSRLSDGALVEFSLIAAAVCGAVIVVRILWVMGYAAAGSLFLRGSSRAPSFRGAVVVAWCGMRGIVTLAAALALPDGDSGFPHRDLLIFTAFSVVLVTLVLQGLTLRPLLALLALPDDGAVEHEVDVARAETARAALAAIDGAPDGEPYDYLRRKYRARVARIENDGNGDAAADDDALAAYDDAYRQVFGAQRRALNQLRDNGTIGDDAYHRVEEELDLAELHTQAMSRR